MIDINLPSVVAEVEHEFAAYDDALAAHDLDRLQTFFWDSPEAVRFGVAENLYGIEAISAFRRAQDRGPGPGVLRHTVITTFGDAFASVCTEFVRGGRRGRQSQTWVRLDVGWRIVSGHVSELGDA